MNPLYITDEEFDIEVIKLLIHTTDDILNTFEIETGDNSLEYAKINNKPCYEYLKNIITTDKIFSH